MVDLLTFLNYRQYLSASLPFRWSAVRSCLVLYQYSTISVRALEAIVSGRADGSAGPTVASFCAALVKTGGSAVLMWAFFHGLQQMSASNATDSAVATLPEQPEDGGLL